MQKIESLLMNNGFEEPKCRGSLVKFILSVIPKDESIHVNLNHGNFSFEETICCSYILEVTPFHVNLSKQNLEVL